ncbi:hypothetical protein [Lacrimispora sp.]|uniref:hypothetical protein n=1 Tax=Lacrimispora sp. TaxID=2719234 RepID=UPI0028AD74FD|nr:hypothetical protein [Lacrimispora sp.]
MIDGIIALVICYLAKGWYQPLFDRYTQIKLAQGHSLASIQQPLDLFELTIQISAFMIAYAFVALIKHLSKKL